MMSKVLFPRNVTKGMFNFSMQIGPLNLSIVQIFILMVGLGLGFVVFQMTSSTGGNKTTGLIVAAPVVLLGVFIAFFRVAEMGLLPFLAKIARNYFFDTSQKYQTNYMRVTTEHDLLLKRTKSKETKEKIEQKTLNLSKDDLSKVQQGGLL